MTVSATAESVEIHRVLGCEIVASLRFAQYHSGGAAVDKFGLFYPESLFALFFSPFRNNEQTVVPVSILRRKSKDLLKGALKNARTAGLAAALVPLGSLTAHATHEDLPDVTSRVDGTVVVDGTRPTSTRPTSQFCYEFTVFNTTTEFASGGAYEIWEWYLPIFDPGDVVDVFSPEGWTYEIVAPGDSSSDGTTWSWDPDHDPALLASPGLYGPPAAETAFLPSSGNVYGLRWYTSEFGEFGDTIPIGSELGDFGFYSEYGDANAPYQTGHIFVPPVLGDPPSPTNPPGLPASPAYQAAIGGATSPVPEPGSMALFGIGTVVMFVGAGIRRRQKQTATDVELEDN